MQWRYGTTRTVLLIGKYAVKFPALTEWHLFLKGLLANMVEAKFGTMTDEPFKSGLCPVIFSLPGGFMNVMPRCNPLTAGEYDDQLVDTWIWPVPVESKVDSVGYLDGRIVAVDYGN